MMQASKKRNDLFDEEQGKGKGKFLNSIFKTARKNHSLAWARNPDGSLAMTPKEVGACVTRKFESWFATVMPVEERWGARLSECTPDKESVAWRLMLDMDTSSMDNTQRPIAPQISMGFADFVEECYQDGEVLRRAEVEDWWGNMLDPITLEEISTAVSNTTSNTAQGASKVHVNMLKKITDLSPLVVLFNKFLEERRVPDEMNVALLRLLPKTEDGLADLDKTRPIALLETVGKLYERVIIQRVMAAFASHDILDMGQYGAMPEAGTAPPLRVLAEVLQDAHLSKSELHVIALDLRKAFDTCEYWSQALSWRAIGMPAEVVNVLVNLDAGSNNPGDRYAGPGPTTSVILDAGHTSEPFTHGRGVRQGSVGGPIKWVVFMNAWLKWIKRTMQGKGYVMSGSRQKGEEVEVNAQMFVDDSIWFANSPTHAQELVRRCELFCDFHKVRINKDKSNYVSMNDSGQQMRWTPWPNQKPSDAIFERTGVHGPIRRPKKGELDGRVFKYLGVLFEAQPGWHAQIEVLKRKHQELVSKLRFVNISIEQAVYAINAKIVPAMAYALQVATVPESLIRKWDKAHCGIIRRIGKLNAASAIQDHFFHLPKSEGGLGLSSILLERNKSLIAMDFHANNEANLKLGQSLQSKVVRAGRMHMNRPSSIHYTIHNVMAHLGCAFHETPPEYRIQEAMDLDSSTTI